MTPWGLALGAMTVKDADAELLLYEAVMLAVCVEVTEVVVAVNVADVAPAATVTEDGTVTEALLSDSVIVAPPVGAAAANVVVQVAEEPPVRDEGEHCRVSGFATEAVMEPPVPETDVGIPFAPTPITLLIGIETLAPAPGVRLAVTVAMTPFPIRLVFIPVARHVIDVAPDAQLSVLLAGRADPGATLKDAMSFDA